MPFPRVARAALVGLLTLPLPTAAAAQPPAADVAGNDNRLAAGALVDGILTARLYAGRGDWRPEESDGPSLTVAAFGEEGGPLLTPGPLLRVPEGTAIVLHIRNTLAERLNVHGLVTRPAAEDIAFTIEPGQTREIQFVASSAGTYHYWATTATSALNTRKASESQLGGAFIVDPRGPVEADRVFVITQWDDSNRRTDTGGSAFDRRVFAINGRSWPHTERLDERVGRTVHWHLVNLAQEEHPMHLHGFYFSVRGVGDGRQYARYDRDQFRDVVTEPIGVGRTFQMVWTPERPGNWLFHCHIRGHVTPTLRFWKSPEPADAHAHAGHDPATAMAGLVMGIRVTGEAPTTPRMQSSAAARRLTLSMLRRPGYWHPEDAYGFALETDNRGARPDDVTVPGPLLVLTRNQPVEITLKNNLPDATAVHWHGIELESYFDGIPGWSGTSANTTPGIDSGGTFVVRFTPPRAGTFIYHTHSHDPGQLAAGLYGAIVVTEPDEKFDPATDHVLVLGMGGPKDVQKYERFPVLVNGSLSTVVTLKAGVPNRLRFINITTSFGGLNVTLYSGAQPLEWQLIAKDGADLPLNQREKRPAFRQTVNVGETYDFVVQPPPSGPTWLELRRSTGEWVQQVRVLVAP